MAHTPWIDIAYGAEIGYGAKIDFVNRVFNCPKCEHPIYEKEWEHNEDEHWSWVHGFFCPYCGGMIEYD